MLSVQAKTFIRSYSQHPAGTVGSTLCTDLKSGQSFAAVDRTWVTLSDASSHCISAKARHKSTVRLQTYFTHIPEEVMEQMVQEGTVMKCAGALMIENPLLAPYITRFDGTKDAIMGLPKDAVLRLLAAAVKASSQ